MTNQTKAEQVHTRIWLEDPEPDNAFATRIAYCHGYDVYGQMLGRSRWVEMLYLLFRGEAPTTEQADLLEALAVALANAGPRDPAIHAAMCAGVGGSPSAAALMAALAVGAGQYSGARDIFLAMQAWIDCGTDLDAWRRCIAGPMSGPIGIWPQPEHPAGFDPYGVSTALPVKQTLECLAQLGTAPLLRWLLEERPSLEEAAELPLSLGIVAAAALVDLGFSPEQGEMLHLLMRLPGAAAHALEQRERGHKSFPFFAMELENDPAAGKETA